MSNPDRTPDHAGAQTLRLFFALWPEDAVRARLAAHRGAWSFPSTARVYRPDDLHVTLHFLGNVPAERVPELCHQAGIPFDPFELRLGHAACWPHGLAVIEPVELPPALTRLHDALGDRLRALGLPVETRRYRPHVTLARRADGAAPPATGVRPIAWRVHDYVLVQSTGDPVARYRVLCRFRVDVC